jgi:hypothetical protein
MLASEKLRGVTGNVGLGQSPRLTPVVSGPLKANGQTFFFLISASQGRQLLPHRPRQEAIAC